MPIIGNGDIASVLIDRPDMLYFCSGVSNSQETRESEYQREKELLLEQPAYQHIVYFGSLAVFYSNTRYTQHKLEMESLVKEFPTYTIFRIGNITWGKNPNTLINYLRAHPEAEIRDEERYIIDEDELLHWIGRIPTWSCEINVTGRRMSIKEIWSQYVERK